MLNSSTGMKTSLQKKKQPNPISTQTNNNNTSTSAESIMNRTSLSSISQSTNKEKLSQLKERLEKERETIRSSTGRRFRDGGKEGKEIEIQTETEVESIGGRKDDVKGQRMSKGSKVSTGVGSNAGGLFDFGSLKAQVENKIKGVFTKKPQNSLKDTSTPIIPVYTTKQILEMSNNNSNPINTTNNNNRKESKEQQRELKRETINLMELSQVISQSSELSQSQEKNKKNRELSTELFVTFPTKNNNNNSANNEKPNLNNSRPSTTNSINVFQTAISEQKVKLEKFADELISMGFDEIETLLEVTVEELNMVRMRAKEQDKLMAFIKKYKKENNIDDGEEEQEESNKNPFIDNKQQKNSFPVTTRRPVSAIPTTIKTEPSEQSTENSRLRSTTSHFNLKTPSEEESTLFNKSSIFYFMGGNEWSLESQIRKACSGCFKVSYDGVKRGECYYCEECDPGEDSFEISLDESMVRNYQ